MQAAPSTPSASIMRGHHNTSFNIGMAPRLWPDQGKDARNGHVQP
ncbi:hypothetical protein [uncultured Pseudosulfitobacter sp.]|tara:strand:+ start:24588 stop:24722 length:135 start_codon:yes stop_codon:yes gene_type:complete